jgi:hypothetical protein
MKRDDSQNARSDLEPEHTDAGELSVRDGPVRLFHAGDPKSHQFRALAFDLDEASNISLHEALPGWEIEVIYDAATASQSQHWDPAATDLLVVTIGDDPKQSLALCRFLSCRSGFSLDHQENAANHAGQNREEQEQKPPAGAPLLVLMHPGQEDIVSAALEAGAESCLVLPIHAKDIAGMLARARRLNQPGRHTLNLDRAQMEDRWRDDGGQG